MDLIPTVKRLWDAWDVRMLVVLSLTLQIILFVFGNRRKNISSLLLTVVVWLSYTSADWVATIALSKLSNAQVNHASTTNALGALWAPLILLHLGGPDTITAYSLEDNQLWVRHLLGLIVQFSVAVYVIFMSWKNSWFSFMSFPALVAGIVKYGERTWVLKSISDDEGKDTIWFRGASRIEISNFRRLEDNYIRALTLADQHIRSFKAYIKNYDIFSHSIEFPTELIDLGDRKDESYFWDVLEIEMGLMYDSLYTKVCILYTKVGWILRCISSACTVTVSVGFFSLLFWENKWHEHYSKVDIAITGVLLVGALTLEIYGVIVMLSSDWAMIWLIERNRSEWVTKLREKIPRLFRKKKYWCKKMGQFDLLGFCLKETAKPEKLSIRILGSFLWGEYKDKLKRSMHKTSVDVPPQIYGMLLEYCIHLSTASRGILDEEDQIWRTLGYGRAFHEQILISHIVTEICYHLDLDTPSKKSSSSSSTGHEEPSDPSWMQNKEICKTLSHYMMHMRLACPLLLPISAADDSDLIEFIDHYKKVFEHVHDARSACQILEGRQQEVSSAQDARVIVEYLMEKHKAKRWEMLRNMWLRMICYTASRGQRNPHLQQLKQGGELLTLVWFFLPQSTVFNGVNLTKVTERLPNIFRP